MCLSVFAVDLGATWLRSALVRPAEREVSHRSRSPTPGSATAGRRVLEAAWKCAGSPPLVAVAAAPELAPDGRIRRWPNRSDWVGETILPTALLTGASVRIFDDATAAALSAHSADDPAGSGTTVCMMIGTGIGGGAVIGGRPLLGRRGAAMDVGHMPVPAAAGAGCPCGRTGCLQAVASGRAVARALGREQFAGPDLFRQRDGETREVLERAVQAIVEGLAILHSVFDAGRYAVGGGFGLSPLFERIAEHPLCRQLALPIERHPCGDDAGLIGAAIGSALEETT